MNPKLSSFEHQRQQADPCHVVDQVSPSATQAESSDEFAEGDDAAFAKVATLMMDFPASEPEAVSTEAPSEPLKYIQGVVQGKQAFIITNLPDESQTLAQPQMVWTIGRNREAAIPLRDRAMSRRHAVILYIQGVGFQLIDLNSMNGSFVNGDRIQQRHVLKDGDRIRVGSINFTFYVSQRSRALDPIHPEVLARFNTSEPRSKPFIDYAELEDPEVLFKSRT
ncbi:MAG: FHA domain-containing protein [Verrucomicrobia bacterium]|nr:FHA domain-containing protein [Leptolyngbya sp. ES-bin-22]